MEFNVNQVVLNNRGDYGFVAAYNGKPCLIVYASFTSRPSQFDDTLAIKNKGAENPYSIAKVYNAPMSMDFKDILKKSFKPEENGCTLDWERPKTTKECDNVK